VWLANFEPVLKTGWVTSALDFASPTVRGIALSSAISGPRCVSVGKKLASQSPTLQKALKLAGILHDDPKPVKK